MKQDVLVSDGRPTTFGARLHQQQLRFQEPALHVQCDRAHALATACNHAHAYYAKLIVDSTLQAHLLALPMVHLQAHHLAKQSSSKTILNCLPSTVASAPVYLTTWQRDPSFGACELVRRRCTPANATEEDLHTRENKHPDNCMREAHEWSLTPCKARTRPQRWSAQRPTRWDRTCLGQPR